MSIPRSKLKIALGVLAALAVLTLVALAVGYWLVVPGVAEDVMRGRLASLEKVGLKASTESISPDGLDGVIVKGFTLGGDGDEPIVRVETMRVGIDKARLLAGDKVISGISLDGTRVRVTATPDGRIDLLDALQRARGSSSGDDTSDAVSGRPLGMPSVFRYFGDQWPDVSATDTVVTFIDSSGRLPLSEAIVPEFELDGDGDEASFSFTSSITPVADHPTFILPSGVTAEGVAAFPLSESRAVVTLDAPAGLRTLTTRPALAHLGATISGVTLAPGFDVSLDEVVVSSSLEGADDAPLLEIANVHVTPRELSIRGLIEDPTSLRLARVSISRPVVRVGWSRAGVSVYSDILELLEPEAADLVTSRARRIASKLAEDAAAALAKEQGLEPPTPPEPPARATIARRVLDLATRLAADALPLLPDEIVVEDATLLATDERIIPVARPASELQITGGRLTITRDADAGAVVVEGGFAALANSSERRGETSLSLTINPRTGAGALEATVDALDLSWLGQMIGPRLGRRVRGGVLRAKVSASRTAGQPRVSFSGDVSLSDLDVFVAKLAETPLRDWSVGYAFKGYFDPDAPIPAAKLLRSELDANVPDDPADEGKSTRRITVAPPTKGALVFTRGDASLTGVKASVKPTFYGIDPDKTLPARLDLELDFPRTNVQTLFDAIPDALMGDIVGISMNGDISWKMRAEVPVYDASEMVWSDEPEVSNFSLVSIPSKVDVRKLAGAFTHTIVDDRVNFERSVRVASMQPIPAQWIIDQAGLTLEQVDAHWRRGDWFPPPVEMEERNPRLASSPAYWTTPHILDQAAPRPWVESPGSEGFDGFGVVEAVTTPVRRNWRPYKEGKTVKMESSPYGEYHFVPLQHISKWLPRAILTTEDNSFFRHDGFNRHALRQSIERNIAAGDYVRGASTISMQLIKNLFLNRKKVMARKLQEGFLVWLMESHVQIPKARLLEIYLNIIEFGPGVFGIHDAAVHYFGKRPDELTYAECAWLVTIVPGPKKYHFYYERGAITRSYFSRMKRYMRVIRARGRATQEEYDAAAAEIPPFYKPGPNDPPLAPPKLVEVPILLDPDLEDATPPTDFEIPFLDLFD